MNTWRRQLWFGLGLLAAVWGVVLLFGLILNRPGAPGPPGPERLWLPAVSGSRIEDALDLARRLVAVGELDAPRAEYVELCRRLGVDPAFLSADFGVWDVAHWRRAWETRRLANHLAADADDPAAVVAAIFRQVRDRLDPAADDAADARREPLAAWHAGTGNPAEAAWLLADLLTARGFDARLAVLLPAPGEAAARYVVEVHAAERVRVLDPAAGRLHDGRPLAALLTAPESRRELWPEAPETAVFHFLLPAWPQDFCPRNQALADRLRPALGDDLPPFGADPAARLDALAAAGHPVSVMATPFRLFREHH